MAQVDDELVLMLERLRASHPDADALYRFGQCYNLFLVIRAIRPHAAPWYDPVEGHVYSRVGAYWYDIRGVHRRLAPHAAPLDHQRPDKPHRWGRRDRRRLVDPAPALSLPEAP